jgi:hypothetical protein
MTKRIKKITKKSENKYNLSVVDLAHYNIPHIEERQSKNYIYFGLDNLYPQFLIELFTGSGINSAIIKGVSSMIAGDQQDTLQGLDVVDRENLEGEQKEQFLLLSKLLKKGSRNTIKNLAFDLKLFGTCYINILWNKTKTAIAELKHIPAQYIRSGKADSFGEINEYYYSYDWRDERKYKPHVIKAFDEKNRTDTSQLLQIKEYNPQSFYYGIPDYIGATDYIRLDMSIAELHLANIENNFMPSCMVNFANGIPTEEERKEVERKLNAKFSGSGNSGKLIITFNDGKDTAPEIIPLSTGENDDRYQFLSTEVSRKVLSAHRITSPLLFGIKGDGSGFGNNADELRDSYSLFNNIVVKVFQSTLFEGLDRIFRINGINALDIYFKTLKPADFLDLDHIDAIDEQEEGVDIVEESIEKMRKIISQHDNKKLNGIELDEFIEMSDDDMDIVFNDLEGEKIDGEEWEIVDEREQGSEEPYENWANRLIAQKKEFAKDYINSKPSGFSYLDKSFYKIRFKYFKQSKKQNKSGTSRLFCRNMMSRSGQGIVYRLEDIDKASRDGVNKQLGHKRRPYDLFKFKGGVYCFHAWKEVLYRLKKGTEIKKGEEMPSEIADYKKVSEIPKTYKPKPTGIKESRTAPIGWRNRGHYPGVK